MAATKVQTMTAGQAGRVLGVHRLTVRKWCSTGRLKHSVNKEGEYRILPADFLAFLREYGFDTAAEKFVAQAAG